MGLRDYSLQELQDEIKRREDASKKIIQFKIEYRNDYFFNEKGFCENPDQIKVTDYATVLIAKSEKGWHSGVCSINKCFDDKQIAFIYGIEELIKSYKINLVFEKASRNEIRINELEKILDKLYIIRDNSILLYDLSKFEL